MVCFIGGLIGVVVGIGGGLATSAIAGWRVIFTVAPIVIAFACAFLTGIVFGYLPARKAAQLDPIEALARDGKRQRCGPDRQPLFVTRRFNRFIEANAVHLTRISHRICSGAGSEEQAADNKRDRQRRGGGVENSLCRPRSVGILSLLRQAS